MLPRRQDAYQPAPPPAPVHSGPPQRGPAPRPPAPVYGGPPPSRRPGPLLRQRRHSRRSRRRRSREASGGGSARTVTNRSKPGAQRAFSLTGTDRLCGVGVDVGVQSGLLSLRIPSRKRGSNQSCPRPRHSTWSINSPKWESSRLPSSAARRSCDRIGCRSPPRSPAGACATLTTGGYKLSSVMAQRMRDPASRRPRSPSTGWKRPMTHCADERQSRRSRLPHRRVPARCRRRRRLQYPNQSPNDHRASGALPGAAAGGRDRLAIAADGPVGARGRPAGAVAAAV